MRPRHAGRPAFVVVLVVLLLGVLTPQRAWASKRSMIPAGQEPRIRELLEVAVAEARAADEPALAEPFVFEVDKDRIRVPVGAGSDALPDAWLVVFHPEAVLVNFRRERVELAVGVVLECGPPTRPVACPAAMAEAWTPLARRLASAREAHVEQIWRVEASLTGIRGAERAPADRREPSAVWLDRGAMLLALALGLTLITTKLWAHRQRRGEARAVHAARIEAVALLALLGLFVLATVTQTALLPLHEHNSFVARSDCAIDEGCTSDPAGGAWLMTSLHGYGLLLAALPSYRGASLAGLSLALSVLALLLVWALTRRLTVELGRPDLAGAAGIGAVASLACNPVMWRLAGSATFWPWTCCWLLTAALAGLWAAFARVDEDPGERRLGALAWLLATIGLGFASAGNLVCLSLGPLLVLAPVCWRSAFGGRGRPGPTLALAGLALACFAVLVGPDYVAGFERVFGPHGVDESLTLAGVLGQFGPLLLDPRVTAPSWALLAGTGLLLAGHRLRTQPRAAKLRALLLVAPLGYAYLAPTLALNVAAGELIGSGYPVGFINHHYELVVSAIAVGLGLAGLIAALQRRWPERAGPSWRRWPIVVPAVAVLAGLLLARTASEGWRMATGERVLERELVALERSVPRLPEHDLLVVGPRIFTPLTAGDHGYDPLEVAFPVGIYAQGMREAGGEPASVVQLDRMPEPQSGQRILLYVGSGLRSFRPDEIAAGMVPDALERPELAQLRAAWTLEPVLEFELETAQHDAISLRLGADRVARVELGFYWMRPRARE